MARGAARNSTDCLTKSSPAPRSKSAFLLSTGCRNDRNLGTSRGRSFSRSVHCIAPRTSAANREPHSVLMNRSCAGNHGATVCGSIRPGRIRGSAPGADRRKLGSGIVAGSEASAPRRTPGALCSNRRRMPPGFFPHTVRFIFGNIRPGDSSMAFPTSGRASKSRAITRAN